MIVSNKNNLLYDSRNFDQYVNVYAIFVNHNKKQELDEAIENKSNSVCVEYYKNENWLDCYFIVEKIINGFNPSSLYKIVYGHFYNNADMFLYKNVYNDKIVNYKINKCSYEALLYNDNKNLIANNSYYSIKKQASLISTNQYDTYQKFYKNEYIKPLEILYNKNDENIIINAMIENYATITYDNDNEVLSITSINILIKK